MLALISPGILFSVVSHFTHAIPEGSTTSIRLHYENTDVSVLSPSESCTAMRDRYTEQLSTRETWERVRRSSCFALRRKRTGPCTPFLLPATVGGEIDVERTNLPAYRAVSDLYFACKPAGSGRCTASLQIFGGHRVVFTKEVSRPP